MNRLLPLLLIALAAPAQATDAPRSVIPWLSESLAQDPWDDSLLPMFQDPNGAIAGVSPFSQDAITTSSLDDPVREGVGLLSPSETGFPADLWGRSSALRVRSLIAGRKPGGVPATRELFRRMLVAETAAPLGAGASNALLLARIDKLLEGGFVQDAAAIVEQLNLTDPDIFRRAFDIALLTGREEDVCTRLRASPALSPTLPARVFCLARGGDWDAAALTLQTGHDVGLISGDEEHLLALFLDPAGAETMEVPEDDGTVTTLKFVLREAVALPRTTARLPLAFEHLDAVAENALRTRMEAMERLVAYGAAPAADLFALYRQGAPASSGGIWDRVKVVQDLDDAFAMGAVEAIAPALAAADETLTYAGLRHAFAQSFRRQLAALDPASFDTPTRQAVFELLFLADAPEEAARWLQDRGDAVSRYLRALVDGASDFPVSGSLVPLKGAIAAGLTADAPPDEQSAEIAAIVRRQPVWRGADPHARPARSRCGGRSGRRRRRALPSAQGGA